MWVYVEEEDTAKGVKETHRVGCKRSGVLLIHLSSFHMADEEPVDQKQLLEETCKPKCVKPLFEYQACVKRIQGDETGHKHCTGQYFDYWQCVDKCVALKLFDKLK
ncbi:Cytochrome b-c1 complex subunit 6 [Heracleum sosnowskyi]|uniref:Complex III subunit VI n=1 Tax=Heracleum sosnowskyi TaxID=360622 RepID=A0AAD8JEL2_9APIA|nr:Cytochrome b-c1 complex subunit 6 [Heracleum sosnowskyi]KAK1402338.1 Cytochrome b-c1 complex subunit 6 [Heracleum sosnowskyi]